MFNEKLSYSINILSRMIKSQINYMAKCKYIKLGQKNFEKKMNSETLKTNLICICEDKLVVFKSGIKGIKLLITYENLDSIDIDFTYEKIIRMNLKNPLRNSTQLILSLDNRYSFLNKLRINYTIFHSQKNGKYVELTSNYVKMIPNLEILNLNKSELLIEKKNEDFYKSCPKDSDVRQLNNHLFYIKKGFSLEDINIFSYNKAKPTKDPEVFLNSRLIIQTAEILPIEYLIAKNDISDFAFFAYKTFYHSMFNNFKINKFWVTYNSSYLKKINITKDSSQWQGWKIECRTKPHKYHNGGFNLIFIFLRRKYLPPLYDCYQDFNFILTEEYLSNDILQCSEFSESLIETAANSIASEEIHLSNKDFLKIIKSKMDCFLFDSSSLDFFINNIQIYGDQSYKLGLAYTFKIVLILSEHVRERMFNLKEKLLIRIGNAYEGESEFSSESYEKTIRSTDIEKLTLDSDNYFINFFKNIPDEKTKILWEDKRIDFLVFCINGGLTYNLLNLRQIVNILKKILDLRFINSELNKLLNFRVRTISGEDFEPKIDSIIYNMYNIKEFNYNEEILCIMIEKDYLRILQDVESEIIYTEFLKYLLNSHFSNKILNSIYFFLKSFCINMENESGDDDNEQENNMYDSTSILKESLGKLTSVFLKIYSNSQLCPTVLTIVCQCLIILVKFDKFNKTNLITQSSLNLITSYMFYPEEKLAFYSSELFSNIISEAKDSIDEIIANRPQQIMSFFRFLKGSSIPGAYYSSKSLIIHFKICNNLISIQSSNIRELLSSKKNKKFVKYLFLFLQDNEQIVPKEIEQHIKVMEKLFEMLNLIVNKNIEMRKYLQESFKILKYIDLKCSRFVEFFKMSLGISEFKNFNYLEHEDLYLKLFHVVIKFLKKFVSNDLNATKTVSMNYFNICSFVCILFDNRESEKSKFMANDCEELYNILFVNSFKIFYD